MEESVEDLTDRISQVPEFIIHHIMSFLNSPKDRVRMSVLSKNWFALTASFPILDFNILKFKCKDGNLKDKFFNYVDYATSRFCNQNVTSAHTFRLVTQLVVSTEVDIANRCLELIVMKGVQVLVIDDRSSDKPRYRVPNQLLSASSLTTLKIRGCELPSSLMVDPVKFNYLKLLNLQFLYLDDEVFKNLTSKCPLLEEIILRYCLGFKRFCVYGLQNLQKVQIESGVEMIDIEAPNLRDVSVINGGTPSMNLASCKKLTTLTYYACALKSEVFSDFLSNVPFIQNLNLRLPYICKKLKLSSSSLRKLVLIDQKKSKLEEIDITTPNLLLFKYYTHSNLPALVVRDSLQPKARLECYPEDDVDSLWFQKLRQLLDMKTGFKVLKLQIDFVTFLDVEELKMIQSPPNELENIELKLIDMYGLSDYEAVVDAVLWCCRPQSLNITSRFQTINSEERNQVVKYTYEKLLQQEDDGQINIWMVLCSSKTEKHFSDLNSLLTALPCVEQEHVITFIKEEAIQEEAG